MQPNSDLVKITNEPSKLFFIIKKRLSGCLELKPTHRKYKIKTKPREVFYDISRVSAIQELKMFRI